MGTRIALPVLAAAIALAVLTAGAPAFAATLEVAPDATWSGDFGLGLEIPDTGPAYVETDSPDNETRYVVRFYFNADGLSLGTGGSLVLFRGLSGALTPIVTVLLRSDGGAGRELVYTVKTDAAEDLDRRHTGRIRLALARARLGRGGGPGHERWLPQHSPRPRAHRRLDHARQRPVGDRRPRWGAVTLTAPLGGTMWLDSFASGRTGPIGPILAGSLDLDGNGALEALGDGLLFLRSSFGFTGAALIAGAVGNGCRYCTAPAIESRLVALQAVLDVDDDEDVDALTDALLVLRYLFGFSGATLTSGAVGDGAARNTPAAVTAYLALLE